MRIFEQLDMLQPCVINNDRNSQISLVNPVGADLLISDDIVSNPIIRKLFMTRKYHLVYFSPIFDYNSRNPFYIVLFFIYTLFYFQRYFPFFPLSSSSFFFWMPLMFPIYSSFASFIPHLTCNDPDTNLIFCLHLILLIITWYFLSINCDIMGQSYVSWH